MKIGDKASFQKQITETDINNFANVVGDFNPIHFDEEKAKKTIFGNRVAHGMLVGSLISTVLGMYMPGEGTVYLEQNCKFRLPVYINDVLDVEVECVEIINYTKKIVKLENLITNQNGEVVVIGYSIVKVDDKVLEEL